MHILVVNDDGPPSPQSSPYVHSLVRELQAHGHTVSVCLPHTQRSWIGKAHMIGQTVKPTYYRPPPASAPAAGISSGVAAPPDGAAAAASDDDAGHHGTTHPRPSTQPGTEEWILVDGTPASCVQVGLYHFFQDRGPIDLVVSGPNYGRNSTAVFAMSSGTLGGALEAALCRRRAIALSYAFFTRNHEPDVIAAASRQSVRVIEALWRQWPTEPGAVDLYSVNVPLIQNVENGRVLWTGMLQNYWGEGSCFTEVEGSVDGEVLEEERIRSEEPQGEPIAADVPHKHKHFKWSPRFTDVYKSVDDAPPGNDGWAVKEGHTSVTPLKANFWHAAPQLEGQELKLETPLTPDVVVAPEPPTASQPIVALQPREPDLPEARTTDHFYALINYEDDYVQPIILSAMDALFPSSGWSRLSLPPGSLEGAEVSLASLVQSPGARILQITQYESIDWDYADRYAETTLVNSYTIRKALIRKHFLSATVETWVAKHPDSVLKHHVKRSEAFEVDYAEFLDDALIEAFDLRASLERNETVAALTSEDAVPDLEAPTADSPTTRASGETTAPSLADKREWWILKPSMSDRGQGIRLFSTIDELQGIFDGWEAEAPDSDSDEGDRDEQGQGAAGDDDDEQKDYITASHLRHFVAQPYIDPPLLLPQLGNRKFHIRTYVLAVGSLKVYVYSDMLALFAAKPYQPPSASLDGADDEPIDLDAHLTNTCLQGPAVAAEASSVHRFADLPLTAEQHSSIQNQICEVTGELFEAAARGMMVHFQPLEYAFEVFGLDFLVDAAGTAWLLEANAFPDFKQTGTDGRLRDVVAGFWAGVLRLAVMPFVGRNVGGKEAKEVVGGAYSEIGKEEEDKSGEDGMVLVRDIHLGRRWGV
ncbi:sure-like protein [Thozetella sp. PMI_491]|nr:sure-like protein [Thozetella sp. PMI_491]